MVKHCFKSVSHLSTDFRRVLKGGVGPIGLFEAGVVPAAAFSELGGVEALEAEEGGRLLLMEEYGEEPREAEVEAYSTTPTSRCPASMATAKAVRPSLSLTWTSVSGWSRRYFTMSMCPCSAAIQVTRIIHRHSLIV